MISLSSIVHQQNPGTNTANADGRENNCLVQVGFGFFLSLYYLDAEGNISELWHGKLGQHQTWNGGEMWSKSTRLTCL